LKLSIRWCNLGDSRMQRETLPSAAFVSLGQERARFT
jgi:hypothetical protein